MVLSIIGDGSDDQQAAERSGISPHTVNTHRKAIMAKLKLHHKGQLMLYAAGNFRSLQSHLSAKPADSADSNVPERSFSAPWPAPPKRSFRTFCIVWRNAGQSIAFDVAAKMPRLPPISTPLEREERGSHFTLEII